MMTEKTRVKRKKEKKVQKIPVKTLAVQSFASIF